MPQIKVHRKTHAAGRGAHPNFPEARSSIEGGLQDITQTRILQGTRGRDNLTSKMPWPTFFSRKCRKNNDIEYDTQFLTVGNIRSAWTLTLIPIFSNISAKRGSREASPHQSEHIFGPKRATHLSIISPIRTHSYAPSSVEERSIYSDTNRDGASLGCSSKM